MRSEVFNRANFFKCFLESKMFLTENWYEPAMCDTNIPNCGGLFEIYSNFLMCFFQTSLNM